MVRKVLAPHKDCCQDCRYGRCARRRCELSKTELTDIIVDGVSFSKKNAGASVGVALDVIAEALKEGQTVGLPGIGTFSVKATAARTGVLPGTSEKIQIAAGKKVSFKIATDLKKWF